MEFVLAKYAGQIFDMGEHEKRAPLLVPSNLHTYTVSKEFIFTHCLQGSIIDHILQ